MLFYFLPSEVNDETDDEQHGAEGAAEAEDEEEEVSCECRWREVRRWSEGGAGGEVEGVLDTGSTTARDRGRGQEGGKEGGWAGALLQVLQVRHPVIRGHH